jgi:hypothetical protein
LQSRKVSSSESSETPVAAPEPVFGHQGVGRLILGYANSIVQRKSDGLFLRSYTQAAYKNKKNNQ